MESLEEKQQISTLLDIYGGLLTDRQRDFIDLYYNEDLSYGEIAESEDISRQAVHDTINHGKKALVRFEEHLQLAGKKSNCVEENSDKKSSRDEDVLVKMKKEIAELTRLVSVDITYDMTPIQRRVKKLRDIIGFYED